ncbi:FAD-dependent oxidoreductase [Leptothrix ochracea]|jgi:glycine oxidase|uniref:FAD-dependent oxidoreductase n=1 Tax=Leptothrix ochracea TaxID=735331 RepID=UPI0034E2C76B
MKIGIAGAGVLGRLLAWQLGSAGHTVTVFDPALGPGWSADTTLARAAGFTAAGMLSPLAELECANVAVAGLGWRTLALWPARLAELAALGRRTGDAELSTIEAAFSQLGSLLVAHGGDRGSAQRLLALIAAKVPDRVPRALDAAALAQTEPALARSLLAWQLDGEGHIHTVAVLAALARGAAQLGVNFVWGRSVQDVQPGRIDAEAFDWVFDVRGTGARPDLPVRGVRGEVFWLHAPGVLLQRPLRLLHPRHRVYMVPRPGERIVIGASEIESEDRSVVSLRTTVELLAAAHSVIPELSEARVIWSEANLRPALPDNLPLRETRDGLVRINGLFRHGWLIGPALVEQALAALSL